jgi:hypothetical protein
VRRPALAGVLLALGAGGGSVAAEAGIDADITPGRYSFEAGAEVFSWREYEDSGRRLLSENGPRFRLSAAYGNFLTAPAGLLFDVGVTGQTGDVDYDGQDNSGRSVATTTRYRGYGVKAQAGYRRPFARAGLAIDVFGALELTGWRREIHSGVNAIGQSVGGFIEDYTVVSGRLGFGLTHPAGHVPARLAVGLKVPLDIDEDVVVSGRRVALEPGRRVSAFASWQLSLAPATDGTPFGTYLHLYWNAHRFDRSPARATGDLSVWQPESHMDEIGLALGVKY